MLLKILVFLTFLGSQNIALAQQLNQKFDTKNHSKAQGVWAQIRYPDGWTAKEGQRPNIVQLFTGKQDGVDVQLHLIIQDAGENIEKECSKTSEAEWNEETSDKASNQIVSNSKKIKIEGKPGFISDLSIEMQRADIKMTIAVKRMSVCHKKIMITLWCATGAVGENNQQAKNNLTKVDSLCRLYFNSFVLMEKY